MTKLLEREENFVLSVILIPAKASFYFFTGYIFIFPVGMVIDNWMGYNPLIEGGVIKLLKDQPGFMYLFVLMMIPGLAIQSYSKWRDLKKLREEGRD